MKHLIIIGAGGMGRCLYCMAKECLGYGEEFDVKGFVDDNLNALDGFQGYPPVLDTIDCYEIDSDDVFACSIGDVQTKRKVCDMLKLKGAKFQTLIHKAAIVWKDCKIGEGTIIDEGCHIDPNVTIGNDCLIQAKAMIGHDSVIGSYTRVDSFCALVGGTIVKEGAAIYTRAMVNHRVTVGEGATVGACSFVIKNVKPGTTVFGVPAKAIY